MKRTIFLLLFVILVLTSKNTWAHEEQHREQAAQEKSVSKPDYSEIKDHIEALTKRISELEKEERDQGQKLRNLQQKIDDLKRK